MKNFPASRVAWTVISILVPLVLIYVVYDNHRLKNEISSLRIEQEVRNVTKSESVCPLLPPFLQEEEVKLRLRIKLIEANDLLFSPEELFLAWKSIIDHQNNYFKGLGFSDKLLMLATKIGENESCSVGVISALEIDKLSIEDRKVLIPVLINLIESKRFSQETKLRMASLLIYIDPSHNDQVNTRKEKALANLYTNLPKDQKPKSQIEVINRNELEEYIKKNKKN